MDSGRQKFSENIWFVWSKMSYSGDMEGCHACGRTTDGRTECEDSARILETEFAMIMTVMILVVVVPICPNPPTSAAHPFPKQVAAVASQSVTIEHNLHFVFSCPKQLNR